VDFVMLNRLAELMVRSVPKLRRALRMTYPFVFADEFQDATGARRKAENDGVLPVRAAFSTPAVSAGGRPLTDSATHRLS
jgi:hypothetical protein